MITSRSAVFNFADIDNLGYDYVLEKTIKGFSFISY